MSSTEAQADLTELSAEIVSAYVANNSVPVSDLAALISSVHAALHGLTQPADAQQAGPEKATPAQIRKSITPDALISFIDGKPYKTLKRHLTKHGIDMAGYRERFGLPHDYPSTSVNYSAARSQLARTLGLGRKASQAVAPEPDPEPAPVETTPARASKGAAPKSTEPKSAEPKSAEPKGAAPKGRGRRKGGSVAEAAE
ncbi:MucR family transcriptional regulator [Methylobacterium symbioticum]|uniref:Transcriptional regulatory protein ros n=1 Tax=Methylobacterium symbioticum TaxID=2584084 RepID=A0A509ENV5_9HYPH|nr:MucR family transcriptional regulator [Methylobacterium symbioticum]VUD75055.1 Transcriptional regulatory protein ros [Methylobacterium symbioticum]